MSNSDYLPKNDPGKRIWFSNFVNVLPGYAPTLGLSDDTVKKLSRWSKNFGLTLDVLEKYRTYGIALTAYKNIMRDGKVEPGQLPEVPAPLVLDGEIEGDIFGQVRLLVNSIKGSKKYNESMGKALGIEVSATGGGGGAEPPKPELGIELLGGRPNILWKKGKMDAIRIHVDRGTGTFEFLAIDTHPDYLDTHPLPELGKSELWRYIAIYLKQDEPVGEWSDPVQISVTGRPA